MFIPDPQDAALQKIKFINFYYFCGSFSAPLTPLNPDPNRIGSTGPLFRPRTDHAMPSKKAKSISWDSPFIGKSYLGQLNNGGEEGLAQLLDPNHLVHTVQVGDDVQPNLQQSVLVISCKKSSKNKLPYEEYRVKKASKTNTKKNPEQKNN